MSGLSEKRSELDHPLIALPTHDELAEQMFVRDLKMLVMTDIEPGQAALAKEETANLPESSSNNPVNELRNRMSQHQSFRTWLALKREAQRQMWSTVADSVERQAETLEELANVENPLGSVRTNPDFVVPEYVKDDIHLMPGGNYIDDGSIMQGAVMDRGGAVYMLGRNGGMLNDLRGQTAMAHVLTRFPDIRPERILDMGCGIGASTVPAAQAFPEAEVHGIDVGASILRYALGRAEHLGAAVHFSQQSAEHTDFPDNHFDIVYSCAVFHETSEAAVMKILEESKRILKPGGIALHLEVPLLHDNTDLWVELNGALEAQYNNEPNWHGALTADYPTLMAAAGFSNVECGYQSTSPAARTGPLEFGPENKGVFRSWFVASGVA